MLLERAIQVTSGSKTSKFPAEAYPNSQ